MKNVVLARLSLITAPGMRMDLVTSGMVRAEQVSAEDGKVIVPIYIPEGYEGDLDALKRLVEDRLSGLDEIRNLLVVLTAEREAPPAPEPPKLKKRPTEAPGKDIVEYIA